ncbi:MAG: YARHG domain-containing protein, partial [Bacteroidales bacterium]|nr:YARHG domain-containing protein [Bacteroidales bacterium]
IPKLDIAMYKAYNDTLLTNDEVAGFGKYELGILRNLIFAKHNYDFSTEFYQAYFNLYAFYNNEEMRKTRTKDVNGKLTETDKANLKLIKEQEAKISQ